MMGRHSLPSHCPVDEHWSSGKPLAVVNQVPMNTGVCLFCTFYILSRRWESQFTHFLPTLDTFIALYLATRLDVKWHFLTVSDMYFPDNRWYWVWVHGLRGHGSLFLCKWSVQIFHSLLKAWITSHFVIELLVFFTYSGNKFHVRHTQIFSQSVTFFLALIKSSESLEFYLKG